MGSNNLQPPVPDTAPPSYEAAIRSSSPHRLSTEIPAARIARNGLTPEQRRSMEDEQRPLPPGWIRQFDPEEQHQFFVDTNANPPRSIWVHPYDDEQYLSTLSPEERQKVSRLRRTVTLDDITAESSDEEDNHAQLPPRDNAQAGGRSGHATSSDASLTGIHRFGRKLKDKVTNSTHEERERVRQKRAEEERKAAIAHLQARRAMIRALETGEPQFLCKDRDGQDVYILPPDGPGFRGQGIGYNPYAQGSPYASRNARFVRPAAPYSRPYGYGYGGGYGMPLATGFLGGAMLGGLLF